MLGKKEIQLLIASDSIEHKKELVKQLIEKNYNARGCMLKHTGWPCGYVADFERNGKSFERNILIVSGNAIDVMAVIRSGIEESSKMIPGNAIFARLECFLFVPLTDEKGLTDYADFECGINLSFHQMEEMAEEAKGTEYLSMLLKDHGEDEGKPFVIDREKKIIYDLFTTGAAVAGIKNSFVSSFIQLALFDKDCMSPKELKDAVGRNLDNMPDSVYDSSLELEITNGHLEYNDKTCKLTDEFRQHLKELTETTSATERLLYKEFEECLDKYGIKDLSKKVMDKIMAIYQSHYKSESDPFDGHETNDKRDKKLYNALIHIIIGGGKSLDEGRQLTNELLSVVGKSEYLNKISLTSMFTGMFNSGQLEEYMSRQQRIVFLDTQILLNVLCLLYQDIDYGDMLYDSTAMLWQQLKESRDFVKLNTTNGYVDEVANHLCEAHSLSRFLSLPYIRDLGKSKNVFFNFYVYLQESEEMIFDGFEDFLADLLGSDDPIPVGINEKKDFFYNVVAEIFEAANIEIKTTDSPEDLTAYKDEYKLVLTRCNMWYKNYSSQLRDILSSYYLSDERNFVNLDTGMPETPFLITLDRTMFPYMQSMEKIFGRKRYYVYPPVKFANRLSVMNMKIDSAKVNYNIICLTEKNYNASSETMTMMDIISQLMTSSSMEGKITPQKLAALKRSQQDDVEAKDFASKHNDSLPIDMVLTDIFRHYRQTGKTKVLLLGKLFEDNAKTDALVAILSKYCKRYLIPKTLNKEQMFTEIDNLMEVRNE